MLNEKDWILIIDTLMFSSCVDVTYKYGKKSQRKWLNWLKKY